MKAAFRLKNCDDIKIHHTRVHGADDGIHATDCTNLSVSDSNFSVYRSAINACNTNGIETSGLETTILTQENGKKKLEIKSENYSKQETSCSNKIYGWSKKYILPVLGLCALIWGTLADSIANFQFLGWMK